MHVELGCHRADKFGLNPLKCPHPTESESRETLDSFIETMIDLAQQAETEPEALRNAPITTPVGRLDEVAAAKNMDLVYSPEQ